MTIIYIEEIDRVSDGEITKTTFDNEDAALEEAGTDILNLMRDNWDLSDEDERHAASTIQDLIRTRSYRDVISEYNYHEERRSANYPIFVTVSSEHVKQSAAPHDFIDFSEYEEEEDEEEDEEITPASTAYVATSPGATCRGPCRNPSPDAYADQRDGTYVCYQCKLFGGVFGKP